MDTIGQYTVGPSLRWKFNARWVLSNSVFSKGIKVHETDKDLSRI